MASTEQDGGELAALRDLVQSEGWKILRLHAGSEWGPIGYGERMRKALTAVANGPDRAYEIAQHAEQVEATSKAVDELIAWPTARIKALEAPAASRQPYAMLRRQRS